MAAASAPLGSKTNLGAWRRIWDSPQRAFFRVPNEPLSRTIFGSAVSLIYKAGLRAHTFLEAWKAMRPVACALLTILLSVCPGGATVSAEESGFWRWPFGRSDAAEPAGGAHARATGAASPRMAAATSTVPSSSYAQPPHPDTSTSLDSNQRWMYESPTSRVSWPRIHMPEFTLPKPRLPRPQFLPRQEQVNEARNAWVQQNPNPARPSPLQAVKQGAQRVGDSTRRAWHKTVDVLTPGDPPRTRSSRIARRNVKPPIWKRMFKSEEPQQGPRTISEWMAQERLDP